jgi:hypothetical protein
VRKASESSHHPAPPVKIRVEGSYFRLRGSVTLLTTPRRIKGNGTARTSTPTTSPQAGERDARILPRQP